MYIKQGELIQDELVQIFTYKPVGLVSASEKQILKLYDMGVIKPLDFELMQNLHKFKMCTIDQLSKLVNEDASFIETRLSYLVKNRLCNSFGIGESENEILKDDALMIYTIDFGATVLLKHYTDYADIESWRIDDLIMTSTKVNRQLMTNEFYLRLKNTLKDNLIFFNVDPLMSCGKEKYSPKAHFRISYDGQYKDFILDSIREIDFYNGYETRYSTKVSKCETLVVTNAWKKYVGDDAKEAPVVLFLGDTEESMRRMALLASTTQIPAYRLCNLRSISGTLSKAFYKYENDQLKNVLAKTFSEVKAKKKEG